MFKDCLVYMISCESRQAERDDTLAQLAAVGIEPDFVNLMACNPPSIEANRYGAYTGARLAAHSGLLFLEDDIDVAKDFPLFLEVAIRESRVTTFCVMRDRLYPEGYLDSARNKARKRGDVYHRELVELDRRQSEAKRGFHGSQAIYLPPEAVYAVIGDRDSFVNDDGSQKPPGTIRHGFDFWVKEHGWEHGGIWAAFPNPVQHRSRAPSTFGGTGVFQSASFKLTRFDDIELRGA